MLIDDVMLNTTRNGYEIRHVIMGKKLWNNLKSQFQVNMMESNAEYNLGNKYDGLLLWGFIKQRINPSIKVGATKLKKGIEKKELQDFGDDVIKLNTWFGDTRLSIIGEEGEGYNKYL